MLERLYMRGVGPAPEMGLDFATRLNVLTGDNGVGKSFVLDIAWWALTRTWIDRVVRPNPGAPPATIEYRFRTKTGRVQWVESAFKSREQAWWTPPGRPPAPGLVIYARLDGGFSIWDPLRNYLKNAPTFGVRDSTRPAAFHFSPSTIWNGLTDGDRVLCNGILRDVVTWQSEKTSEFDLLCRVMGLLSPSPTEQLTLSAPVRMDPTDARRVPTLALPYGVVPLPLASAAIKRVLALAYLLVWSWSEHHQFALETGSDATRARSILLLVDELEAHVHPKWQRRIMRALLAAVEALGATRDGGADAAVQVLAVTHSPLILASLEPIFDPARDALFNLELVGDHVEVRRPDWRPRGDVGAWLTSEVFNLKEARSLEAEEAITRARAALGAEDLSLDDCRRIHAELHAVLKETDPFWPRWLARLDKAGLVP